MGDADPKVTVVIPCFNHGRYLDEAVQSALNQTCRALEVIVVDDGSTDLETVQLLSSYQRPRTTVLRTAHQGPAAARNAAIDVARGAYILPLDADDWIDAEYAEAASAVLEREPGVGIVYCDAELVDGERREPWHLPDYAMPRILLGNVIFATAMFRKADWARIGGYNLNMVEGWEDYDLWLSLIGLGCTVHKLPRTLFYYRQRSGTRTVALDLRKQAELFAKLVHNHPTLYFRHRTYLFESYLALHEEAHRLRTELHRLRSDRSVAVKNAARAVVASMRSVARRVYRRLGLRGHR